MNKITILTLLLSVAIITPQTSFVQVKSNDKVELTQTYSVTRNYKKWTTKGFIRLLYT